MTLYEYWRSLSEEDKRDFCAAINLTFDYVNVQLIHARRKPRIECIQAMVDHSKGQLTLQGLFDIFLKKPDETVARIVADDNVQEVAS
jgi:hypothetical protein